MSGYFIRLAALIAAATLLFAWPAYANTGHWRTIGVAAMTDPGGSCGSTGLSAMGEDDGVNLQWIACGPGYACDTPTDLHIAVPDFANVT